MNLAKRFPGLSILFVIGKWAGFHVELIFPKAFRIVVGWFCLHINFADYDRITGWAIEKAMILEKYIESEE